MIFFFFFELAKVIRALVRTCHYVQQKNVEYNVQKSNLQKSRGILLRNRMSTLYSYILSHVKVDENANSPIFFFQQIDQVFVVSLLSQMYYEYV